MGSFVAFLMLGLYPMPGTKQFLITTPYFPRFTIYNPVYDKTATFTTKGFVGNPRTSATNGTRKTVGEYRYIKVCSSVLVVQAWLIAPYRASRLTE
jgi:hypothetical protein